MLPAPERAERQFHDDKALSTAKAYGEWLFHGPRFQVIERIDGLSPQGAGASDAQHAARAVARRRRRRTGLGVRPGPARRGRAQMAWLWSRAYRDESALPTRFGRVVRYRERFPERMHAVHAHSQRRPTLIRGNLLFLDEAGEAVMSIEELDSIASAALNRFGGTAKEASHVAA